MKSGMGKLLTFIMAAFLLVFAGYHAYRHFFSDYTTENVYRYTVYHSTTAQGVFFREEKSLDRSAGSNLRYAVRDGEKVLAIAYGSLPLAGIIQSFPMASVPGKLGVKWTHVDSNQTVNEESKDITLAGDGVTDFQISKPSGWPTGKYKVEISLDGNVVQTREFEVR